MRIAKPTAFELALKNGKKHEMNGDGARAKKSLGDLRYRVKKHDELVKSGLIKADPSSSWSFSDIEKVIGIIRTAKPNAFMRALENAKIHETNGDAAKVKKSLDNLRNRVKKEYNKLVQSGEVDPLPHPKPVNN